MDLAAVVGRVRGMLFEPDATLAAHGVPAPNWRVVVREHALPVLILTSIGAFLLAALSVLGLRGRILRLACWSWSWPCGCWSIWRACS